MVSKFLQKAEVVLNQDIWMLPLPLPIVGIVRQYFPVLDFFQLVLRMWYETAIAHQHLGCIRFSDLKLVCKQHGVKLHKSSSIYSYEEIFSIKIRTSCKLRQFCCEARRGRRGFWEFEEMLQNDFTFVYGLKEMNFKQYSAHWLTVAANNIHDVFKLFQVWLSYEIKKL